MTSTSPLVGELLERWPSLPQLQHAHPGTLRKFFHEHNCRGEERIRERIAAIYQATPATQDAAVLEAGVLVARGLAALLAALRGISRFRQAHRRTGRRPPGRRYYSRLCRAPATRWFRA